MGSVLSQNAFQGTVLVAADGSPVIGAQVLLLPVNSGVFTDTEGRFSFAKIAPGNYELVITALGYEKFTRSLTLGSGDNSLEVKLLRTVAVTEEVFISALRASARTATTYTNVTKEEIAKNNFGQDLPFLLNQTPNTVVTSDAGNGVGYTGLRIRGSDPTRTNVTVNGIPLNDAESHGTYWVNLPDLASSVDNIQVQRGVGTSTNGSAAFGASLNIQTTTLNPEPYASLTNSVGSFNTLRNTFALGTGLLKGKFSFDGRFSLLRSDGYIDRASSDLSSWFLSGSYFGKKSLLKLNVFAGKEQTYQAWWGVPEALLATDRTYNYYTYENETDNYQQNHYQLFYTWKPGQKLDVNAALHYTYGRGYYEQYRNDEDFATYGFAPLVYADTTIATTDLIRRRWLDNHFYGGIFSITYRPNTDLELSLGGGVNRYDGSNFGEVIWARYAAQSAIGDRFYEGDSRKLDMNTYLKAFWSPSTRLSTYLDLQVRHIDYSYGGTDLGPVPIQGAAVFTFFNPKAGATWFFDDRNQLYASFSVANREPVRTDFVDAPEGNVPDAEHLNNLELGYRFRNKWISGSVNMYWMGYKNQLVLNGALNDVGTAVRQNVPDSYRAGIEMAANLRLVPDRLDLALNAAFSQNKIRHFEEIIYAYDADFNFTGTLVNAYTNSDISFSPNVVAGATLSWHPVSPLNISLISKYVGGQFLDNTANPDRKLDPFWLNDLRVQYRFLPNWAKEVTLGVQLNNIFNVLYEPNGYTYNYQYDGQLYVENYYYPMASFNWMGMLTLKF